MAERHGTHSSFTQHASMGDTFARRSRVRSYPGCLDSGDQMDPISRYHTMAWQWHCGQRESLLRTQPSPLGDPPMATTSSPATGRVQTQKILGSVPLFNGSPYYKLRRRRAQSLNQDSPAPLTGWSERSMRAGHQGTVTSPRPTSWCISGATDMRRTKLRSHLVDKTGCNEKSPLMRKHGQPNTEFLSHLDAKVAQSDTLRQYHDLDVGLGTLDCSLPPQPTPWPCHATLLSDMPLLHDNSSHFTASSASANNITLPPSMAVYTEMVSQGHDGLFVSLDADAFDLGDEVWASGFDIKDLS